jgi:hypothetical protein
MTIDLHPGVVIAAFILVGWYVAYCTEDAP